MHIMKFIYESQTDYKDIKHDGWMANFVLN